MNLKNIRKFLAVSLIGSMFLTGAGSLCASASDKKANIPLNQPGLHQNYQENQENQENVYLQNHNIEKSKYDEFLSLSGLNFDEMKNILEKYQDINFDYIYKLSPITKSYWAHYKQLSLTRREIFLQALDVSRALHLECSEADYLEKFLKFNFISLRDVEIFVKKGFSQEQKQNLSMKDLAGQISKVAEETYTDFFRSDFRATGYSAYGACSDLIKRTGWTFDEIFDCLGNKPGILGLECLARRCQQDGKLNFSEVVQTFKDNKLIKINDACYLCRKIVDKRGLAFRDLLNAIDIFEGYTVSEYVDIAERAKESGRTYWNEIEFEYEEAQKRIAGKNI